MTLKQNHEVSSGGYSHEILVPTVVLNGVSVKTTMQFSREHCKIPAFQLNWYM